MNRNDNTRILIVMMAVILLAVLAVRYVILSYTPCSFFTVAEAPVRCVK